MFLDGLAAVLADALRAQLLVGAQGDALVGDASRLATLGAFDHHVRRMDRHRLLDDAALHHPAARFHVFLGDVEALDDDFVLTRHRADDGARLAAIFAGENEDCIALMHMQLGQVQGFLLLRRCCHCALSLPVPFGLYVLSRYAGSGALLMLSGAQPDYCTAWCRSFGIASHARWRSPAKALRGRAR